MAILKRDPEKAQQKEEQRTERARQQEWAAFRASPQGQARQAKEAGRRFFQIVLPLEETARTWRDQQRTTQQEPTGLLESIESEGWTLSDVGYVFQPTGSVIQERLIHSGAKETVSGRGLGIYLFRAVEG